MCGTHWGWAPDFRARSAAIFADAGLPPPARPLYASRLQTPSLHVIADDDARRRFSEAFRDDLFAAPATLTSPTAHKPPVEPRFADAIHDFLRAVLEAPPPVGGKDIS